MVTLQLYGTVEQQGRLTLHLHLLLWIRGAFTPQEIRDKIMDPNSDFQKKLVEYLESVHAGEFFEGTKEEVKIRRQTAELDPNYLVSGPLLRTACTSPVSSPCIYFVQASL